MRLGTSYVLSRFEMSSTKPSCTICVSANRKTTCTGEGSKYEKVRYASDSVDRVPCARLGEGSEYEKVRMCVIQ
jgi:hypothetical protein